MRHSLKIDCARGKGNKKKDTKLKAKIVKGVIHKQNPSYYEYLNLPPRLGLYPKYPKTIFFVTLFLRVTNVMKGP